MDYKRFMQGPGLAQAPQNDSDVKSLQSQGTGGTRIIVYRSVKTLSLCWSAENMLQLTYEPYWC